MYLKTSMLFHIEKYEQQITELEAKIAMLPEGTLHINSNGKYTTWRVSYPNGHTEYLPKEKIETARLLALKNVYLAQLTDLKQEAQACRMYMRCANNSSSALDRLLEKSNAEFQRLLGDSVKSKDKKIHMWESSSYKKYDKYPEALRYKTLKANEFVRSKLEVSGANNMYTLNIPYKYEKVTRIGEYEIAVDFIALDTRIFRETPVEFFGMMEKPEYRKTHDRKMINYINNGYIPGINMLAFYETTEVPLDPQFIRNTLENFFFNNPPIIL